MEPLVGRVAERFDQRMESAPVRQRTPVTEAASALLCYAAGILAGAVTRRVVPAMVATAAAFTALSLFVYGRFYYWMLGFGAAP